MDGAGNWHYGFKDRCADYWRNATDSFLDTALALPFDVTDSAQISLVSKTGEDAFGGIDVLVNNAGYGCRPDALQDPAGDKEKQGSGSARKLRKRQ